jgi:hypothetical protein
VAGEVARADGSGVFGFSMQRDGAVTVNGRSMPSLLGTCGLIAQING